MGRTLLRSANVIEDSRQDIIDLLDEATFSESNVWSALDLLFNSETQEKDTVNYVTVMINNNDEKHRIDAFYTDLRAHFKLASDIVIVHESKSIAGGIFQSEKDVEVKRNKDLGEHELEAIFKFFQIVALRAINATFGFTVEFPKTLN